MLSKPHALKLLGAVCLWREWRRVVEGLGCEGTAPGAGFRGPRPRAKNVMCGAGKAPSHIHPLS